ncbi:DUF6493 family protein [Actinoplanes friuliensis]|uniref:Secreted protein n=1 Tax=Actinoplanes friuliensis DSM 7358 TaxID=1246995 RepID=U5VYX2_9ACTN|nr:DUF6493 family protein [Actinoplanes friuliensis]AGZ42049.1 hypothetical protein AFR_18875 [Actinoplanes friuliensis DSM 7358]
MSLDGETLDRPLRSGDAASVAALLLAATEAERTALADWVETSLKSMRREDWWKVEDTTAGAYALAIIGCLSSPTRAATLLCRRDIRDRWDRVPAAAFLELVRIRELPWLGDLAVRLAGKLTIDGAWQGGWAFVAGLLRESGTLPPATESVLRGWLNTLHDGGADLTPLLRDDPFLDALLPAVFTIDGLGSELNHGRWNKETGEWDNAPRFPAAIVDLIAEGRLARGPILDATVDRLTRGDKPGFLRAFVMLHDLLEPTVDELARHTVAYVQLLPHSGPVIAALAQRALRTLDEAGRLDAETLCEAGGLVLLRKEKNLAKAQLSILDKAAGRDPGRAGEVLETIAVAFGHPALDIQDRALALIAKHLPLLDDPGRDSRLTHLAEAATALGGDLPARAAQLFGAPEPEAAPQVVLPLPPPLPTAEMPPPITSAVELAEQLVALLHERTAVRWEHVLAGLVSLPAAGLPEVLQPVLDRYPDLFVQRYGAWQPRLVYLGEAIRSVIAPHDHGTFWPRMISMAETAGPADSPAVILVLRISELAVRITQTPVPMLVATPTHVNGSLDARVLLTRLQRAEAEGWEPWPIDFDQALLRVPRVTDPEVRAAADALTSPRGREFAAWLAAGGLPDPLSVRLEQLSGKGTRAMRSEELVARRVVAELYPDPTDRLGLETQLVALERSPNPDYSSGSAKTPDVDTMVLPHHREVIAAWSLPGLAGHADQDGRGGGELLPLLADCTGPIGPAMALALAYVFGARHQTDRTAAVDAFLALVPTDGAVAAAVGAELGDLCGDGTIKLNRVVTALTDAHRAGATAAVWEVLAAALPPLLPRAPRGLPDLLELAAQTAGALGVTAELDGLADVASGPGTTRLVKEAKRLHTVLSR